MLARHAAQLPERLLEAFGQCGEALAAADRLDILPAAKCEPEMIEQMRERRAGDCHRKATAIGEIRQRLPTRRVLLAKNELAFRTLGRSPIRDPPLQRAQQSIRIAAGMAALQLAQNRGGAQMRDRLQHRHQFVTPDLDEGILPRAIAPDPALLARQYRVRLDASSGALAEAGASRRRGLAISVLA